MFTRIIYPKVNRLVLNNMCLLLAIGFIMLTRLSYDKAVRQFQIAAVALAVALIVPVLIRKCAFSAEAVRGSTDSCGLALLMAVAVVGKTTSGAKLSLIIGKFVFQPSEFVKITFVFFVAAMLSKSTEFADVVRHDHSGGGPCAGAGGLQRPGRRASVLCDLSGHALCGHEEAPVFFGWPGGRLGGSGHRLSSVCPCAGPGAGLDRPFQRHRK